MLSILIFFVLSAGREVPGKIILWLKPEARSYINWEKNSGKTGIQDIDAVLSEFGVYEVDRLTKGKIPKKAIEYGLDLIFLLKFPEAINSKEIISALKSCEYIRYIFPDKAYPLAVLPNDPMVQDSSMWNIFKMQVPEAWDITQGDSNVVVGAADSGLWWDHPDIIDNLWVNPGEDINNNGKFDYPDDLNGIDDDGNGYVDDIIGWNFSWGTWDPKPQITSDGGGWMHGTHVGGTMAATTDNGIGIAGVGWKVRIAGFNCQLVYHDSTFIDMYSCVEAHYYAANMGFGVVNNSWGGYYWSSAEKEMFQAVVNYCISKGVVVVAAAGNEGVSIELYPAALDSVIAVAATNIYDKKTSWSNYGTWVDVSAPGSGIWSTIPPSGYAAWDGTSMASPNAAGVCALMKSFLPDLPAESIGIYLKLAADNIDSLNQGFEGLLGTGRVNAYRTLMAPFHSGLTFLDYRIVEKYGDFDRIFEQGETLMVYVKVKNKGPKPATGTTEFVLSTQDPSVEIVKQVIQYTGDINVNDTIEISDYFLIVPNNSSGRVKFEFKILANPPAFDSLNYFYITFGSSPLLLVEKGDRKISKYYEKVLDSLSLSYDPWRVSWRGIPPLTLYNPHSVIWFTGNTDINTLTPEESDSIIKYLDNGGNILMSSQYLFDAVNWSDSLIMSQYFGVQVDTISIDPSQVYRVKGISGDTVCDGWLIYLTGGVENYNSPDGLIGVNGGIVCADYKIGPITVSGAAVRKESNYKTFFTSFPLESINIKESAPLIGLRDVIRDVLEWFGMVSINENKKNTPDMNYTRCLLLGSIYYFKNRRNFQVFDNSGREIIGGKGPSILSFKRKGIFFLKDGERTIKIINIKGR